MLSGRLTKVLLAGAAAGLLMTGCTTRGSPPAPLHPGANDGTYPPSNHTEPGPSGAAALPELSTGPLTLEQALARALQRSPELAAQAAEARAATARLQQAGAWPNPEIELAVEEVDRGGAGFDSAETGVTVAQALELGGKRHWRKRVAAAENEQVGRDTESQRLDVLAETARRFVAVLAAQERLDLARSAVDLAEQTDAAVAERVKAGKEPPPQAAKSAAELELARLDALAAEQALGVARGRLAVIWGAATATFDRAVGRLNRVNGVLPPLDALRTRLEATPDLARWDAELRLRRAAVASEKAARIPDLEASAGYLRFKEDGTDALAFGISMPLPLFDRNRGNLAAAREELARAESERTAAAVALAANLAEAHANLLAAHGRVATLQAKVVPVMEQACEAARTGYQQGKFGFMDLLDAQRGLIETRTSLVEALSDYHAAWIDIRRMTATGIDDFNGNEMED